MQTRHGIVYAITIADKIADDESNCSKLEKRNANTKLMLVFLVDTNIDECLWCMSNNKLHVLASFDKIDFKRNQIKNEILQNNVCLLQGIFKGRTYDISTNEYHVPS